jgi:RNA polymerase sporulation-specific sigma factor
VAGVFAEARAAVNDLELILAAQRGDTRAAHALIERFAPTVGALAHQFYLPGADSADVRQEAWLGVAKAIRDFDAARIGDASVHTFVALCIHRQLLTAIATANRGKHRPLNDAIHGSVANDDETLAPLYELHPDPNADPAALLEQRDAVRTITRTIGRMSPLERAALVGIVFEGRSYAELETTADAVSGKSIDNARQRAVKKLRVAIDPAVPPTSAARAA